MSNWFEYGFSALILIAMAWVIFGRGQANPVGTGKLQHDVSDIRMKMNGLEETIRVVSETKHKVNGISMKIVGLEAKVENAPTLEKLDEFERDVDSRMATLEERLKHTATKADVAKVQSSIEHVCKQNDNTDAAIVRIEQFLMGSGRRR